MWKVWGVRVRRGFKAEGMLERKVRFCWERWCGARARIDGRRAEDWNRTSGERVLEVMVRYVLAWNHAGAQLREGDDEMFQSPSFAALDCG